MSDENKHEDDDDEKITLTRGQLKELRDRTMAEATMPEDERKVRGLIRDEVKAAFDELFDVAADDDDDDAGKRKQSPKGTGKKSGAGSLFDAFLGQK